MNDRPKLREMYADLYRMHCTFGGMKPTAENWGDLYNAALNLALKHGNSEFTCKLIAVTIEQIEKEVKR